MRYGSWSAWFRYAVMESDSLSRLLLSACIRQDSNNHMWSTKATEREALSHWLDVTNLRKSTTESGGKGELTSGRWGPNDFDLGDGSVKSKG